MPWALWIGDVPPLLPYQRAPVWDGAAAIALMGGNGSGPATVLPGSPPAAEQDPLAGQFQPLFDADFYNRIHLSVAVLALGNVVGQQQRTVSVWNAHSYGVTLESLVLANSEGIEVSGQPPTPLSFVPLQERAWTITVSPEGPPTIDATATWSFDTGTVLNLSITGNRVSPWTWRPDWARGISESLEWMTDILEAEEGDEQRIGRRITPRQTWAFTSTAVRAERQAMEAAIAGWGARTWAVPLWPHGTDLKVAAQPGDTVLQAAGTYREFTAGGLALVIGDDALVSEVVEVEAVTDTTIVLRRGLSRQWPLGTVIYPAKSARLTDVSISRFTGECSDAGVTFTVVAPNPHPQLDPATLPQHRGYGVLELRPDWSQAPALDADRRVAQSDNGTGIPRQVDRAGYPTLRQVLRYGPLGRVELDYMRQLQYYLAGRLRALWVSSQAQDFHLQALAAPGASNIDVAYTGYTAFLRNQVGRTDIRIQTRAGVQYRQITGSTDLGNGVERLGLAEPLQLLLDPADGVEISFLSLIRGDSDRLEWAWWSGDMGSDNAHADTILATRTFRNEF